MPTSDHDVRLTIAKSATYRRTVKINIKITNKHIPRLLE